MQINKIQTNTNPSFKARVTELSVSEKTINEILPQLRKKLAKGKVDAYLTEFRVGKDEVKTLQIALYGLPSFHKAFSTPLSEATVKKFVKGYFNLQRQYIKAYDDFFSKGAFKKVYHE